MPQISLYGRTKTLLDLIRVRNAIISFFGVYIGAMVFSLGVPINPLVALTAAVSAALILGAGNALNDYFDFEIDKVNRPKRPIPSGRISRSDTFILSLSLFLVGLGVAKSINDYCLTIAAANTVILITYARYSKKMLFVSNLCISYLVASVFIYGAASVYSPTARINPDAITLVSVLTVCAFLINLSREIVKDIEDMDGDRRSYSVTLPIVYGPEISKKIAVLATIATVFVSVTPIIWESAGFNELIYAIFILLTDIVILASFTTPPSVNQRLLVFGMTLALIAFLLGVSTPAMTHY